MEQVQSDGELRLLASVLLLAAKDAAGGDPVAREWLSSDGALWADALGLCEPEAVKAWAACPGHLPRLSDLEKRAGY